MSVLIPERFLRFSIFNLEAEVAKAPDEEKSFWLSRLREYYVVEHGDIHENVEIAKRKFIDELATEINFIFTQLEKGLKLRDELHLEQEEWYNHVRIVFPLNTYTVSYSFFKGFLGESVRVSGSADAFFAKYTLEAPPHLNEVFKAYVQRIMSPF